VFTFVGIELYNGTLAPHVSQICDLRKFAGDVMSEKTPIYLTPLYLALNGAFPAMRSVRGILDVNQLAAATGFTRISIYKALNRGSMSADMAFRIAAASENRLTVADLGEFVRTKEEVRHKKAA
jgi:hypothetical protein